MKIGLLHNEILPPKNYGGIERIVMILAREYTKRGHQVVIFSKSGSHIKDYEHVALPPNFSGDVNPLLPQGLDFLHSHQPLSEKPKIPFLITIHGNGHPEEKYFANTNFLSQSHARNHSAKYFVYNGIDPNDYPFVTQKSDYYVFLARTTWRVKNVKTAIAWANDLNVKLEIMGGSGISRGNIHYNGLVDDKTKFKLLSNAKALIYPTNWDEPCAAAPLEALACGTPVITTPNGCMPELVKPGTGVICSNYTELLDSPNKISTISTQECRKSIEGFFSLSRMTDDYLKLIDKILEMGELDHSPRYNFDKRSVQFLYKPTIFNQLRFKLTGKI